MKKYVLIPMILSLAACSKTVNKNGNTFFQENPDPNPPGSVGCAPAGLGDLLDYAVYVEGDLRTDHVDIGRRVAASYACVQHGAIGASLPPDRNRVDLASAGVLGVNRMTFPRGKVTFGVALENVRSTAFGGISKAATDLGANLRKISEFSRACAATPANTKVTRTCRPCAKDAPGNSGAETCTVKVVGTNEGVNVAELKAEDLADVSAYEVDVPTGASLVMNLPLTRVPAFRGVTVSFIPRTAGVRLYWNLPAVSALEFTGTRFRGTVVAPDADVKVEGQSGEAGFWARSLNANDSSW